LSEEGKVDDEAKSRERLIQELAELRRRITSLQALEDVCEKLRKSEMWYRSLAENVSDVIWTMDMSPKFTYYSPSVVQL
jgi:PAS domain-containing protein